MRIFKIILIMFSFILFLICCALAHVLVTVIRPSIRWRWMSYLSFTLIKFLSRIINLDVVVIGQVKRLREAGNLIISRHVSYIDGLVLGSLTPAIFVSKKEIKAWPLIGAVVAISGTVFIDRIKKSKTADYIQKIVELMRQKINIFVFPEGTSSDGKSVQPFQAVFFKAPLVLRTAVIPVNISYLGINNEPLNDSNKNDLYWYGDMGFFPHFWKLLSFRNIRVRVTVHDAIEAAEYQNDSMGRKVLSQDCYHAICHATGMEGNPNGYQRVKKRPF